MEKTNRLRSRSFFSLVLMIIAIVTFSFNPSHGKSEDENKYLIKFTHTKESCLAALDKISKDDSKLLSKIDWGCMSGDHTGYMIVNGKDEKSVLSMIPESLRDQVKVEKVDKFTKQQIESFHK